MAWWRQCHAAARPRPAAPGVTMRCDFGVMTLRSTAMGKIGLVASLAVAVVCTTACSRRLVVADTEVAKTPTTTISYAGIRAGERRFPDYSGITRKILRKPR